MAKGNTSSIHPLNVCVLGSNLRCLFIRPVACNVCRTQPLLEALTVHASEMPVQKLMWHFLVIIPNEVQVIKGNIPTHSINADIF